MKANELRIGNYYHWCADGKEYLYQIDFKDFLNDNYKNFEPILLTEEWLLKFGFKTHENYFWYKKGNVFSNMLSVGIQNKDGVITIIENVNHVHSLQNLYFALTGEELTLNNVV